jgi:alkylated DNA nucleotide flippase Atl1
MKTFSQKVVELALKIPSGRVTTYGAIAGRAGGGSMAARSVTGILGKAHLEGIKNIPFHRIVYASGKVWMNSEYEQKRNRLYKKEGIKIKDGKIVNFEDYLYDFKNI